MRLLRLHFVRNHAAVPQLHWETHTVSVYSDPPNLMAKPKEWSMDELTSGEFEVFEIPVTLGCDGSKLLVCRQYIDPRTDGDVRSS